MTMYNITVAPDPVTLYILSGSFEIHKFCESQNKMCLTIVVIHETNLRHTRHVICALEMRWQAKCVGQILPVYYERNLFKEFGYLSIIV